MPARDSIRQPPLLWYDPGRVFKRVIECRLDCRARGIRTKLEIDALLEGAIVWDESDLVVLKEGVLVCCPQY